MNIKKLLTLTTLVVGLTNLVTNCDADQKDTQSERRKHDHSGRKGPHDGHGHHNQQAAQGQRGQPKNENQATRRHEHGRTQNNKQQVIV